MRKPQTTRTRSTWQTTLLVAGMAMVLAVAACGGEEAASDAGGSAPDTGGSVETAAPPTEAAPEDTGEPMDQETAGGTETTAPTEATGAEAATVELADSDLGEVLVDGDGRTLYAFLPDEQGVSTCYESCADNWPPVVGEPTAGQGVDESLLATVERDDGSLQVTYGGWPLYLFAGDSAPGDTNGQGVGDVWYVVEAGGEPVQDAAADGQDPAMGTSSGGDDDEDY